MTFLFLVHILRAIKEEVAEEIEHSAQKGGGLDNEGAVKRRENSLMRHINRPMVVTSQLRPPSHAPDAERAGEAE